MAFKGAAYWAEQALIIQLEVATAVQLVCTVCEEKYSHPMQLKQVMIPVPSEEVKGGIYNFAEALREEIVLELPQYGECSGGKCPHRQEVASYLKQEANEDEVHYHPFNDL